VIAAPLLLPLRKIGSLRRRIRDFLRGETAATYFDLNNPREVDPILAAHDAVENDWRAASGDRVRRIFELRPDLREVFPLGYTPHGRRDLLAWLLGCGQNEFGVSADECLRFLHEMDVRPDRGLVPHYLHNPEWQRIVPDALTTNGWPKLVEYLKAKYGIRGRWVRLLRLPHVVHTQPIDHTVGVNVLAHFRYASGLQEAAFGITRGLTHAGVPMSLRDLPVIFPCDWTDRNRYDGLEAYDTTIYVAAANTFPHEWYPKAGLHARPGVRRIAVWYWELDEVPVDWRPHLQWADEVWAPTEFIAGAFRKAVSCPIVAMLPGVELPSFKPKPRSAFGLSHDKYLFLFSFDMGSVMARKNPLAAIEAFRRAFRRDEPVHFAIKVSRGDSRPRDLTRLKEAAKAAGVQLIDRVLPRSDVLALLNTADCYVSAHRSEGLGLGLAESMLLAKPVIATGYSGNLDFTTPETGYLIDYRLVEVEPDPSEHNPYPAGARWAEPSVEHLATLMRHVYENRDEANEKGKRAKLHIERVMSPAAFGKRMKHRLEELRGTRNA
jgi:glycosyltransferase involved in cell wall biosynthesis